MAAHSSILAREGYSSTGSQRVRHDRSDLACKSLKALLQTCCVRLNKQLAFSLPSSEEEDWAIKQSLVTV